MNFAKFPRASFLKLADATPVFKKGDPFDKTNDRLVSVLPTITKIYEKLIQQQKKCKISFISLLVLVMSSYNNQQALVSLIEK